jgi:lipoprotein-anchoring transpeptidase ErfK/SrfK
MRRFVTCGVVALAVLVLSAGLVLHYAAPARAARTTAADVAAIQARLAGLGYLPAGAVDGSLNARTRQAIVAFQGWQRLERTGVAGQTTLARLATAARPRPFPGTGSRIEIYIDRQVALLVRGQTVERAIHVSTGASGTPTPTGDFHVYRKERNSWSVPFSVWLHWASYFTGGVALHAYAEVPPYPASHGCVRIPLSEAPAVYAFARLGVEVRVVR